MTPPLVDPAAFTPREIVALALGTILGAILNSRREPCRRACCVDADSKARRKERWIRGQEFEHAEIPARPFMKADWTAGWSQPRPCSSCASLLEDGRSLLWIAEYSRKFADQCLNELHEAALWIDSLLTRA